MTVKVHGVSMHFYDDRRNSDKFYRAFVWSQDGQHHLAKHWGRDGSHGQSTTDHYPSAEIALRQLRATVRHQLSPRKGYQLLGEGAIHVDDSLLADIPSVGHKLHDWIGRDPVKLPTGYVFIIREEEDIYDLLASAS